MRRAIILFIFLFAVLWTVTECKENKNSTDSSLLKKLRSKRQCGCQQQPPMVCTCKGYAGKHICGCARTQPCACSPTANTPSTPSSCNGICQATCQQSCVRQNQSAQACQSTCVRTCASACLFSASQQTNQQPQQQQQLVLPIITSTASPLKVYINQQTDGSCGNKCMSKCGDVCQAKHYPIALCNNSCQKSCDAVCVGRESVATTTQNPLKIDIQIIPQPVTAATLPPITTPKPQQCMPTCQQMCAEGCGYTVAQSTCLSSCDNTCNSLCNPQSAQTVQNSQSPLSIQINTISEQQHVAPVNYMNPVTSTTPLPLRILINGMQQDVTGQCRDQCNQSCNESCERQPVRPVEGCGASCDNTCVVVCGGGVPSYTQQTTTPTPVVASYQMAPAQRCQSECQNVCQLACVAQRTPAATCQTSCIPECDRACLNPNIQQKSAQLYASLDPNQSLAEALTTTTVPPAVFQYTTAPRCGSSCMPACQPGCTAQTDDAFLKLHINLVTSQPQLSPDACASYCSSTCASQCEGIRNKRCAPVCQANCHKSVCPYRKKRDH